jgi:methyl-accepting chemotaxis protein
MSSLLSTLKGVFTAIFADDDDDEFIYFWEDVEESLPTDDLDSEEIESSNRVLGLHVAISVFAFLVALFGYLGQNLLISVSLFLIIILIGFSYFTFYRSYNSPLERAQKTIQKINKLDFSIDEDFMYLRSAPTFAQLEDFRNTIVDYVKTAKNDVREAQKHMAFMEMEYEGLKDAIGDTGRNISQSIGDVNTYQQTKDHLSTVSIGIDAFISIFDEALVSITNTVVILQSIAKQTTMLSLNAGIEAARAGEKGIGFDIVASNLRRLSQYVVRSTGELKDTTKNISRDAKMEIEQMTTGMNNLSLELDKAFHSIYNIKTSFDVSVVNLEKIKGEMQNIQDKIDKNNSGLAKFST